MIDQTADDEDPDDTAKLEAALTRFEDKMREYHGTLTATRRDRDTARISHEMQQRNTTKFMRERDELAAKIKGWQWAICESEVLRDPALKGRARDILTEIAKTQG